MRTAPRTALVIVTLISLAALPAAFAQLFVSDYGAGTINLYNFNGTNISVPLITGLTNNAGIAVSQTGDIYVASQQGSGAGYVSKYSSTGTLLDAGLVTGLDGPVGLAFDHSDNLYIANFDSGTVSKYSSGGIFTADFITGLNGPSGIAFDSVGNLFVSNYGSGNVGKYDSSGVGTASFLNAGGNAFGVAVSASGILYVALADLDLISEYSAATGTWVKSFATGGRPTSISIANDFLYVDHQADHTVGTYIVGGVNDGTSVDPMAVVGLNNSFGLTAVPIPEPSTYAALAGLGALGLVALRRRR